MLNMLFPPVFFLHRVSNYTTFEQDWLQWFLPFDDSGSNIKLLSRQKARHMMKFDMHCHIKGGSIDSRVTLERYIELLQAHEFDGMMITDHDSYRACRYWDKIRHRPEYQDFVVIKGVEYDTRDAGHFLVIMPDGILLPVLTIRGMPLKKLIRIRRPDRKSVV